MYYPSSENKGDDQLRGYREADLRLCFRLCRLLVFPWGGSLVLLFQEGFVYAVEFSHRSGRDLINVAKKRTNIIPIIEDARHPHKYRMLIGRFMWSKLQNKQIQEQLFCVFPVKLVLMGKATHFGF